MIDETAVIIAAVGIIPSTLSVILVNHVRKAVKIPSGGTIGNVVDITSGNVGAVVAHTTELVNAEHKRTDETNGETH